MNEEIVNYLLSALASAIGALAAGYIGVAWALRRHRVQRAFDRRIEWIEEMHAALHASAQAFDRLYNATGNAAIPAAEIDEADRIVDQRFQKVRSLAAAGELYARPETAQRLADVLDEANSVLLAAVPTSAFDDLQAKRNRQFSLAHLMREAAGVLIPDVHRFLGYLPWWSGGPNSKERPPAKPAP